MKSLAEIFASFCEKAKEGQRAKERITERRRIYWDFKGEVARRETEREDLSKQFAIHLGRALFFKGGGYRISRGVYEMLSNVLFDRLVVLRFWRPDSSLS